MTISSVQPDIKHKKTPTPEQAEFLDAVSAAMDDGESPFMRLTGGPGSGKSFVISRAARAAAEAGWIVFMIGPTHQATGVIASAVPEAAPFDPDPRNQLAAGDIVFCTAHKLAQWVQKSRSVGAARGEVDPVPRDSWLGRSFKADWDNPPAGALVFADEISMYHGRMAQAVMATVASLERTCKRAILVAVGDPDQLTPVRGPSYAYIQHEGPESPSLLLTDPTDHDYRLTVNVRAKSPILRQVVETYKSHRTIPIPSLQDDAGIYSWCDANDRFYENWAKTIEIDGTEACIMLGYRRVTVAAANDKMCQMLHGVASHVLEPGRIMRVQETFSPFGETLAASSDLVEVKTLDAVDDGEAMLRMLLPPRKGHAPAHDPATIAIMRDILADDLKSDGPYPVATVEVFGDRAGMIRQTPVLVASEHDTMTPTAVRWASLETRLTQAAFRQRHDKSEVRRGLAAIYYHVTDSAKLKLEAPYAMTSHRSQGSTYDHVAILADSPRGGRIVDHRIESSRDASAYVMLSRPAESLTVAWVPRLIQSGTFSF